jgi:hypothetical protein
MKSELARVQVAMTNIQDSYGRDHLQLTVVKGYLSKLLKNGPRCRQKGFEFGSSDRLFYFVTRIEILELAV